MIWATCQTCGKRAYPTRHAARIREERAIGLATIREAFDDLRLTWGLPVTRRRSAT